MLRKIEKRLKVAGVLIALGLLVQMATLIRLHPLSFVFFIGVGGPLLAMGIGLFLWSAVSSGGAARRAAPEEGRTNP